MKCAKITRKKTCARKRRYPNAHLAKRAILAIGHDVHPYRCNVCGLWHLSSNDPGGSYLERLNRAFEKAARGRQSAT